MKINCERAFLLVIDVQERLLPAMHEPDRVVDNCRILVQAASRLGVPVLASEQYPKGLGPTVPALAEHLPVAGTYAKLHFSCADDRALRSAIAALGRDQAVLCGIESHVCVSQTALDLVALGPACFVAADATSSRNPDHVAPALARLRGNGVEVVVTEQVLFECLAQAGTNLFKDVSALVK
jgi:nicotinamidase-related amidase